MQFRSLLFTPGNRPDRLLKAVAGGAANIVVADLEDAVAPADKPAARQAVSHAFADMSEAAIRAVRINAWPGSVAEADLDAVVGAGVDLIVVPKAENFPIIDALDARLDEAGSQAKLLLILETAAGVLAARELAAAERVVAVAFGAEDLAADVGMRRSASNWEVSVPRSLVSLAAAAAGVGALDMITADFRDDERLRREAEEARALGYAGKMCIHPGQLPIVHAAFAPTAEEVAWANKVVAAAKAAGASGGGVVVVDGRMIDVPLIQQARRILADQARQ